MCSGQVSLQVSHVPEGYLETGGWEKRGKKYKVKGSTEPRAGMGCGGE